MSGNTNLPYNQLLAVATMAKGEDPMDQSIKSMSSQDQKWLQEALQGKANDMDPIYQLKQLLKQLENFPTTSRELSSSNIDEATATINNERVEELKILVEEKLFDFICDLDLALDFCKLGGLQIIQRFLTDSYMQEPRVSALFLALIAELAQYNPRVQEYFVRDEFFLKNCLDLVDVSKTPMKIANESVRYKSIGALSAIIKGYIPGLVKFVRMNGLEIYKQAFEFSFENSKVNLVRRFAIAVKGIAGSFTETIAEEMKITQLLIDIQTKLETVSDNTYEDALDFIRGEETNK